MKTSMLKKAICAAALSLSMVLPMGSAFADEGIMPLDTTDWGYHFYFPGQGSTYGTAFRQKDTTSATYVLIENIKGNYIQMFVDGATSSSGANVKNCTTSPAYAKYTGQFQLHNWAKEWGYNFVRLTGWAEYGSCEMYGKWSPDCAGRYSSMN